MTATTHPLELRPRYAAWLALTDSTTATPSYHYVVWIGRQWRTWADETGADLRRPKTAEMHAAFDAWLQRRVDRLAVNA